MTTFIKRDEFSTLVQANQYNRHSAILAAASELFVHNTAPTRNDLLHFEELCLRFLPKLDLLAKASIAERLAACAHLPRAVALSLAKEEFCVASPLLQQHAGFTEEDLLIVLANGGPLHAHAISLRRNLSDNLILALSRFKLPDSYAFDGHHVTRRSSPNDHDHASSAFADEALRLVPSQRFSLKLDTFLAYEHAHILTHMHAIEERARAANVDPVQILKSAHNRTQRALNFVALTRRLEQDAFAQLLAAECGLNTLETKLILDDAKGFALAICLKALALPKQVANEAFILLNPELGADTDQVFLLDWFYDQISPAGAREVLGSWSHGIVTTPDRQSRHQSVYEGDALAQSRPQRLYQKTAASKPSARDAVNGG